MKLKNKYGFTLIELLAVIVVLAIIALIATPIVMNTIKNAKKGAAERTADNYIKQVETAVAEAKLENKSVPNGTYDIDGNGNLTGAGLPDGKLEINMSGNKPTSGTVTISNGGVLQAGTTMTVGDYDVIYKDNKYTAATVVYRWSTDVIKIGATIDPTKYTKDASTLGENYYLKHILDKDNKLTESYACAIFNSKEYCVRGGKDNSGNSFYGYAANEADYTGNALILKQIEGAKIEGVSCHFYAYSSNCSGDSVTLSANSSGNVVASITGRSCGVSGVNGSSFCRSS